MFIILFNNDQPVADTIRAQEDSIATDSVVVYEVPEIISLGNQYAEMADKILHAHHEIKPEVYNKDLIDALVPTSSMLYVYGDGQFTSLSLNGLDAHQTSIFLNYHRLNNPLFGYVNLSQFPSQFFETISVGTDTQNPSSNAINLITKINRYDKPYSYIGYTTGDFSTNIYTIDFTRPITNDLGLYLSGLYRTSQGYRDSADWKMGSFYADIYYNRFLPMRLDVLYSSSDYGTPGSSIDARYGRQIDQFLDASVMFGSIHHTAVLFYNQSTKEYSNLISNSSFDNSVRSYGLSTIHYHRLKPVHLLYGFTGSLNTIESDFYGSHRHNAVGLWATSNYVYKTLIISASGRVEVKNADDFFYAPKVAIGLQLFKSVYLVGTVVRGFRVPSLSELDSTTISSSYYNVIGNEDLRTEYYWKQTIGMMGQNFRLQFYTINFTDRIVVQPDINGYNTPSNVDSWHTMGIQTHLEIPLSFTTQTVQWKLSAGLSGNYLLKGDSLPFIPHYVSSLFIDAQRETERFTLGLVALGRFVGTRRDIAGQEISSFNIYSLVGTVRFLTLSCNLGIDNIFNKEYVYMPYYPMAPRNYNFSIQWEFWD